MGIFIREIEPKDYPALLSLWNNELGSNDVTIENIAPHYDRVKGDNHYKTYVALLDDELIGFVSSVQTYAVGYVARHRELGQKERQVSSFFI